MKVTNEKTEKRQAYLKIEMDPAELAEGTQKTYKKLVKKVNIPGFRKGNAPFAVFERFFGKEELFHEAIDDLFPEAYKKAIEEQKLEPIAQPTVELLKDDPVTFEAVVPLRPEVTLGDYKTIDLKPEPVEVKDEMIENVIENLRHQHATWEPSEEPVAYQNVVTLDVESTLNGEPFVNQKGVQYHVLKDAVNPTPGFAEELVGMKKGDEKEFTLKFPEDFARPETAGKEAKYKVKITEVKQEKLPEVNDEFAKSINPEAATVVILREKIVEDLKKHLEDQENRNFEEKVVEAATALSQVDYPPVMVEAEADRILERQFRYLQQTGQDIEQYLQTINKTVEQMREELKPAAEKSLAQGLVIDEISVKEKIEVTQEEVDAEIEEMVKASTGEKENAKKTLNTPRNRETIQRNLVTRKTVQKMAEIARTPKLVKN